MKDRKQGSKPRMKRRREMTNPLMRLAWYIAFQISHCLQKLTQWRVNHSAQNGSVRCVFTQGMRMDLERAVSSFFLFSLLGFQVPLGFNCPVPDGDSATDDLCHCAHCCALRTTPVNSLQCEHIYWPKTVCVNWLLLCPECHELVWNIVLWISDI